jgi:hypothetical protein
MRNSSESSLPWQLEDIPFHEIDLAAVRDREDLFCLIAGSSFVEIISDLTTRNLVSFFGRETDVGEWLADHWEHEEVQHGRALRAYVRQVWPDFDWDASYAGFYAEYSKLCTEEALEPTPCLEMVARCVVEMGTATYYRSLHDFAPEPVLRQLAARIRDDEVRHYKHFYHYFTRYRGAENMGRWPIVKVLKSRLGEVRSDDAAIALWHAYASRHPDARRDGPGFRAVFSGISALVKSHYPAGMAIKMLLKPLTLPPMLSQVLSPPLSKITQRWILR